MGHLRDTHSASSRSSTNAPDPPSTDQSFTNSITSFESITNYLITFSLGTRGNDVCGLSLVFVQDPRQRLRKDLRRLSAPKAIERVPCIESLLSDLVSEKISAVVLLGAFEHRPSHQQLPCADVKPFNTVSCIGRRTTG